MKSTTIVVGILILGALIALAGSLGGEDDADMGVAKIYEDHAEVSGVWHRGSPPKDRWVGFITDRRGFEALDDHIPFHQSATLPDFQEEALLVAYMGQMPTGGYGIRIREVRYERGPGGERALIEIWTWSPGPDAIVTQAFTYPVHSVRIDRSAWPGEALDALLAGELALQVKDQDEQDWGPVHLLPAAR